MNYAERPDPVLIPITPITYSEQHGISCGDCAAACCQENTVMPLDPQEALFMLESGTDIDWFQSDTHKLSRQERKDKVEFYRLQTQCGNLDFPEDGGPGVCTVFDRPERPKICSEFKVGSYCCRVMRIAKGVDDDPGSAVVA